MDKISSRKFSLSTFGTKSKKSKDAVPPPLAPVQSQSPDSTQPVPISSDGSTLAVSSEISTSPFDSEYKPPSGFNLSHAKTVISAFAGLGVGPLSVPGLKAAGQIALEIISIAEVRRFRDSIISSA